MRKLAEVRKSTTTTTIYGSLDNPGEPVPEATFTHSHLLWSSIIPHLLPPSFKIHKKKEQTIKDWMLLLLLLGSLMECEDNIKVRSFCSAHIRCTAPA